MRRFALFALPLALAGCNSLPNITKYLTPYRMDVRQGNYVTQEMVNQLKPGQSRDQVRYILGTPLVADAFHADRWDYVYRFQPGKGEVEQRRLEVHFGKDGKLARLDGDIVAKGGQPSAPAELPPKVVEIPPPNVHATPVPPPPGPAKP